MPLGIRESPVTKVRDCAAVPDRGQHVLKLLPLARMAMHIIGSDERDAGLLSLLPPLCQLLPVSRSPVQLRQRVYAVSEQVAITSQRLRTQRPADLIQHNSRQQSLGSFRHVSEHQPTLILGVSRWNVKYEPGTYIGMSYRFDTQAEKFTMFENLIHVPANSGQMVAFGRDIFDLGHGEIMAVVYTTIRKGVMSSYLMKSTDAGATWNHFSTIGDGPEPSVVRFSDTEMMAILRTLSFGPLLQTWSHDGGKTWSKLVAIEEGSVAPDMVLLSNGVLACSYGRPGSNLMFSTDQGKTWTHHTVITDSGGFNYTAIREVSPGRLLFVHDAPTLRTLYVDVERGDQ